MIMSTIEQNLQAVRESIAQAAADAQRAPGDVTLLAVSKTFGADAVLDAMRVGQAAFGENYLQEALDKIAFVKAAAPQHAPAWHFIGPIQSNKTRPIAEHFDWVHTVEREKIAARLSEQRPASLPDLNICLQVNISGEASKSGVTPAELPALAHAVAHLPRLRLRGLMAIPAPFPDEAPRRAAFRRMRALFDALAARHPGIDTLSMGMSGDFELAIAEGATMVRVGTALFGARPPKPEA